MQKNPMLVVNYIKSTFDVLISLKLEDDLSLLEERNVNGPRKKKRNYNKPRPDDDHYINSSRGGHGAPEIGGAMDSMRSADVVIDQEQYISEPTSSNVTSREGPPKEYEEIIQNLEADVRKHIRIEQQLKLHIETVEGQLDQLELENERLA